MIYYNLNEENYNTIIYNNTLIYNLCQNTIII